MSLVNSLRQLVPQPVKRVYRSRRNRHTIEQWERDGMPAPPPHALKQKVVTTYQKQFNCDTLVETGTYHGAMIEAQLPNFKTIYSVEIDPSLWASQFKRFRKNSSVHIIEGDSGTVLKTIVPRLKGPSVFWLDGHYSGTGTGKGAKDCPIYEELDAIFSSDFNHILLIDDARCFDGTSDYPTIEELFRYVGSKRPRSEMDVSDDIIRILLR